MKKHPWRIPMLICTLTALLLCVLPAVGRFTVTLLPDTAAEISTEPPVQVQLKSGDFVTFGTYLQEPILWRVVQTDDQGRAMLLSEYVLCMKSYDAAGKNEKVHCGSDYEKCGSPAWETSTLRQWLNSREEKITWKYCPPSSENVSNSSNAYDNEAGFLSEKNFTISQYNLIDSSGADRVFLPTEKELLKLLPKDKLSKKCTKSSLLNDNSSFSSALGGNVWYWTPVKANSNRVSLVVKTSASDAFYKALPFDSSIGVCPALYLSSSDVLASGDGRIENPYHIKEAVQ